MRGCLLLQIGTGLPFAPGSLIGTPLFCSLLGFVSFLISVLSVPILKHFSCCILASFVAFSNEISLTFSTKKKMENDYRFHLTLISYSNFLHFLFTLKDSRDLYSDAGYYKL